MRERRSSGLPRVVQHNSVRGAQIPYAVRVDARRVAAVLRREGVSERDIRRLVIVVKDDDPGEAASFEYDDTSRRITIYGHDAWAYYRDARARAAALASGRQQPSNQFEGLLSTTRLAGYLARAPRERSLRYADTLLRAAASRELNADLLHELRHVIDHARGRYRAWFALEGRLMDVLAPLIDRFDPSERSASAFEQKGADDPLYRNLVSLHPRQGE